MALGNKARTIQKYAKYSNRLSGIGKPIYLVEQYALLRKSVKVESVTEVWQTGNQQHCGIF